MGLCTCKYCLCLFKLVVLVSSGFIGLLIISYILFGSMPPSFTMAIGFWLLLYTNFFGIYVLLLTESSFYRNEDIWWINRLTQGGIIACGFCFALGGILFLIPLTAESMMAFCKVYIKIYNDIPPFLDTIQQQYTCCGINDYKDYGYKGFHAKDTRPGGYGTQGFHVYRLANPNDDFFHELVLDLTLNRTVARKTTGLDVPQSCCKFEKAVDPKEKDCGKKVEYTGSNDTNPVHYHKQIQAAVLRVNDPKMGCFRKYDNIKKTGYQFQLTYLIGVIQLMCGVQSITYFGLLWFHRMALKTIRQLHFWLPELMELQGGRHDLLHEVAEVEAEADEAHHIDERKIKKKKKKEKERRNKELLKEKEKPERRSKSRDNLQN